MTLSIVKLGFCRDTHIAMEMKPPPKENDPMKRQKEYMAKILS